MEISPTPPPPVEAGIVQLRPKARGEKPTSHPASLNERLQAKVTLLIEHLYERRKGLLAGAGESFRSEELSFAERKEQYRALRSSPTLLLKTLASNAIVGSDGRLRLTNKILDALVEMSDTNG